MSEHHVLEFYGLREQPFATGSDCRFVYLDRTRREALASLYFGVLCSRNLLVLVAADGMGKTLLLYELAGRLRRNEHIAFLTDAPRDRGELLRRTGEAFGLTLAGGNPAATRDQLLQFAIDERMAGRRSVLIVDDAHLLDTSSLETIEGLSAHGGPPHDLLQVVLAGSPSLLAKLENPRLLALRQRVTPVPTLDPLSAADTAGYVDFRLRTAGHEGATPVFTPEAITRVAAATGGVPRRIDEVCRRALALGCTGNARRIGLSIVEEAVDRPEPDRSTTPEAAHAPLLEEPVEALPMAVGQGSVLTFPMLSGSAAWQRDAGPALPVVGRHASAPVWRTVAHVAELSPPARSPAGQREPWGPHAAIEDAVKPRERSAAELRPQAKTAPDPQKRNAECPARPVAYAPPPDSPQLSKLVQRLLATLGGGGPRSIVFVSVDQGAHTVKLCADVAKTLAAAGHLQGLVVDADRHVSALADQFGVGSRAGFSEVLDGRLSIEAAVVSVGPNLSLLTSGLVPRPGGFCLLPERVEHLMGELKKRFDYVLVNGMPLDKGNDSVVFGTCAEGALLVVAAHATRRTAARKAKEQLEAAGAHLLGAVLTERTFPIPDFIYRRL